MGRTFRLSIGDRGWADVGDDLLPEILGPIYEWLGFQVGNNRLVILAGDPVFMKSVVNTIVFTAVVVPVQGGLGLLLALLVNHRMRGVNAAETTRGRAILGEVDGGSPLGVETEQDVADRKALLRRLGYKL